jgi:hypothetical protein
LIITAELVLFSLFWNFTFNAGDREQLKGLFRHASGISAGLLPAVGPE